MSKLLIGTNNTQVLPALILNQGAYGATVTNWLGSVNAQGVLVPDPTPIDLVFSGVTALSRNPDDDTITILDGKFDQNNLNLYNIKLNSLSFPDLTEVNDSLKCTFTGQTLTSVSFLALTTATNTASDSEDYGAFYLTFKDNLDLETYSMPNLSTAGNMSFDQTFCETGVTTSSFDSLSNIGEGSFRETFSYCKALIRSSFNGLFNLSGDSNNSFYSTFANCSSLRVIEMKNLETVTGTNLFSLMCENCTDLAIFWLPRLSMLEPWNFNNTFVGVKNLTMRFPALSTYDYQSDPETLPDNFANGVINLTIHFPKALQTEINNSTNASNLFGASSGTVLCDIIQRFDCNGETYERREWLAPSDNLPAFDYMVWENLNNLDADDYVYTAGIEPNDNDNVYSDTDLTTVIGQATNLK